MKKKTKKLVLSKETVRGLFSQVEGGATVVECTNGCTLVCTQGCPTGPIQCWTKYPC